MNKFTLTIEPLESRDTPSTFYAGGPPPLIVPPHLIACPTHDPYLVGSSPRHFGPRLPGTVTVQSPGVTLTIITVF